MEQTVHAHYRAWFAFGLTMFYMPAMAYETWSRLLSQPQPAPIGKVHAGVPEPPVQDATITETPPALRYAKEGNLITLVFPRRLAH